MRKPTETAHSAVPNWQLEPGKLWLQVIPQNSIDSMPVKTLKAGNYEYNPMPQDSRFVGSHYALSEASTKIGGTQNDATLSTSSNRTMNGGYGSASMPRAKSMAGNRGNNFRHQKTSGNHDHVTLATVSAMYKVTGDPDNLASPVSSMKSMDRGYGAISKPSAKSLAGRDGAKLSHPKPSKISDHGSREPQPMHWKTPNIDDHVVLKAASSMSYPSVAINNNPYSLNQSPVETQQSLFPRLENIHDYGVVDIHPKKMESVFVEKPRPITWEDSHIIPIPFDPPVNLHLSIKHNAELNPLNPHQHMIEYSFKPVESNFQPILPLDMEIASAPVQISMQKHEKKLTKNVAAIETSAKIESSEQHSFGQETSSMSEIALGRHQPLSIMGRKEKSTTLMNVDEVPMDNDDVSNDFEPITTDTEPLEVITI